MKREQIESIYAFGIETQDALPLNAWIPLNGSFRFEGPYILFDYGPDDALFILPDDLLQELMENYWTCNQSSGVLVGPIDLILPTNKYYKGNKPIQLIGTDLDDPVDLEVYLPKFESSEVRSRIRSNPDFQMT